MKLYVRYFDLPNIQNQFQLRQVWHILRLAVSISVQCVKSKVIILWKKKPKTQNPNIKA